MTIPSLLPGRVNATVVFVDAPLLTYCVLGESSKTDRVGLAPLDAVTRMVQLLECTLDSQSPWKQSALIEPTFLCFNRPGFLNEQGSTQLMLRVYQTFTNENATISATELRAFLELVVGPPMEALRALGPVLPFVDRVAGVPVTYFFPLFPVVSSKKDTLEKIAWFKKANQNAWIDTDMLWTATRKIPNGTAISPHILSGCFLPI